MRAAAVQLESSPDRDHNLARAAELVTEAAASGARLVVLPEMFGYLGHGGAMRDIAEPLDGPTVGWAKGQASLHGVHLLAGSFVERVDDGGEERFFNTSCLLSPTGELVATYRKIHLFDVEVPGAGIHESGLYSSGDAVIVAAFDDGTERVRLGLAVCYDLRFPEMFRIQALEGATITALPSAFTAATGPAHWEVLIRARAIENQTYVVAADLCGTSADGVRRHGHSVIVDPWGEVIADAGEAEGVIVGDLDAAEVERVRESVPSLLNRMPTAYRWG